VETENLQLLHQAFLTPKYCRSYTIMADKKKLRLVSKKKNKYLLHSEPLRHYFYQIPHQFCRKPEENSHEDAAYSPFCTDSTPSKLQRKRYPAASLLMAVKT
jgi:hypothetical protein